MKAKLLGSEFVVWVSEDEVSDFGKTWPCSELCHGDRVTFNFSSRNGDLIDAQIRHCYAGIVERDGPSLVALADDAKAYGKKRLNLNF